MLTGRPTRAGIYTWFFVAEAPGWSKRVQVTMLVINFRGHKRTAAAAMCPLSRTSRTLPCANR